MYKMTAWIGERSDQQRLNQSFLMMMTSLLMPVRTFVMRTIQSSVYISHHHAKVVMVWPNQTFEEIVKRPFLLPEEQHMAHHQTRSDRSHIQMTMSLSVCCHPFGVA